MSEKRSICKQVKLRFLPDGTLGEDFYGNALMQLPASRSKNRAQGLGYAPMPPDHLAEVFRMDTQLKHDHLLSLDRTNLPSSGWSTRALTTFSTSSFIGGTPEFS